MSLEEHKYQMKPEDTVFIMAVLALAICVLLEVMALIHIHQIDKDVYSIKNIIEDARYGKHKR